MKKQKILAGALALGMVLGMGVQAFGAAAIEKVQAYVNHEMRFQFDGEEAPLPTGYQVIVYEGRSYVPARFIAEKLGAEVEWNETTKVIAISSAAIAKPEEPGKEEEQTPVDKTNYKKLPLTRDADKFRLSMTSFYKEDNSSNYDKLYLVLTNNGSTSPIVLEQSATVFQVGAKEYKVPADDYGQADQNWYQGVARDGEQSGFLLIPKGLKEESKFSVVVTVRSNGEYPAWEQELTFDVDTGKKK